MPVPLKRFFWSAVHNCFFDDLSISLFLYNPSPFHLLVDLNSIRLLFAPYLIFLHLNFLPLFCPIRIFT